MPTAIFSMLLENLAGEVPENSTGYIPKERAYEDLKRLTGEDCGYDVTAWKQFEGKVSNESASALSMTADEAKRRMTELKRRRRGTA